MIDSHRNEWNKELLSKVLKASQILANSKSANYLPIYIGSKKKRKFKLPRKVKKAFKKKYGNAKYHWWKQLYEYNVSISHMSHPNWDSSDTHIPNFDFDDAYFSVYMEPYGFKPSGDKFEVVVPIV